MMRKSSFAVADVCDLRQKSFLEVLKREFTKVDNLCRTEMRDLEAKLKIVKDNVRNFDIVVLNIC